MEKILSILHYGWSSHAMELIKGDLNLIKVEKAKTKPNDHLIADIGRGIEKLLDTIEISIRLDEIGKKVIGWGADLRNDQPNHNELMLGEPLRCYKTAIVHPELSFPINPSTNGNGNLQFHGAYSLFQHIVPPNRESSTWQLLFEVLASSYSMASFLVQENIEAERGYLCCSHLPDLYKILNYLNTKQGDIMLGELRQICGLYQYPNGNTGANAGAGAGDADGASSIVIDMSSFEMKPVSSSDPSYSRHLAEKVQCWGTCFRGLLDLLPSGATGAQAGHGAVAGHGAGADGSGNEARDHLAAEEALHLKLSQFLTHLTSNVPPPVAYLTLHYLVNDSLLYSMDLKEKLHYYKWVVDVYHVSVFLTALGQVEGGAFEGVIEKLRKAGANQSWDESSVEESNGVSRRVYSDSEMARIKHIEAAWRIVVNWETFIEVREKMRSGLVTESFKGTACTVYGMHRHTDRKSVV